MENSLKSRQVAHPTKKKSWENSIPKERSSNYLVYKMSTFTLHKSIIKEMAKEKFIKLYQNFSDGLYKISI